MYSICRASGTFDVDFNLTVRQKIFSINKLKSPPLLYSRGHGSMSSAILCQSAQLNVHQYVLI